MREVSHMVVRPAAEALQRPVDHAPRLTAASCDMLREVEIVDEFGERRRIDVPAERPLTIFLDGHEFVTLMTLGASPELLVLGYLYNQRLIDGVSEIESIEVDWDLGAASVKSRSGVTATTGREAVPTARSGCGLGTVLGGWVTDPQAIPPPLASTARISQRRLCRVLEIMSEQESLHRGAGSVHGCALFNAAELLVFVEDVGRHNALDTLIGWMAQHGVAGGDKILYTTGRLSAEMVIKAAQIGIPIVVSRNGATAMGLDVASKLGMTLIGRAMKRRFLCYVGAERFDAEAERRDASSGAAEK